LPPGYTIRRRVKGIKPVSDQEQQDKPAPKHIPEDEMRQHPRTVELKLIDEAFQPTKVQEFPSIYKACKFLGTFSSVVLTFNGCCYKS
jgi:hypothetical protein